MPTDDNSLLHLDQFAMENAGSAPNRWAHRALGVILAGGKATRMVGQDKPLIEIAGKRLIDHCAERLAPQVGQIVISGNDDLSRFGTDLPVFSDDVEGYAGPLAGILAAMRWAQDHAPDTFWVISAAADTPFFPDNLVDRFVMAMGGPEPSVVLAQSGEQVHPTFGLWPIALADDLEAFLKAGDRKIILWAERHNCSHAIFRGVEIDGLEIDPFFNVNTPDDVPVAEAIADGLSEMSE